MIPIYLVHNEIRILNSFRIGQTYDRDRNDSTSHYGFRNDSLPASKGNGGPDTFDRLATVATTLTGEHSDMLAEHLSL